MVKMKNLRKSKKKEQEESIPQEEANREEKVENKSDEEEVDLEKESENEEDAKEDKEENKEEKENENEEEKEEAEDEKKEVSRIPGLGFYEQEVERTSQILPPIHSEHEEDTISNSEDEAEAMQPMKMFFSPTDNVKTIMLSSKCYIAKAMKTIECTLEEDELKWLYEHPQFQQFFHMNEKTSSK